MENLPPQMKMIASTQGDVLALQVAINALIETLSPAQSEAFLENIDRQAEAARASLPPSVMPEEAIQRFELVVRTMRPTP